MNLALLPLIIPNVFSNPPVILIPGLYGSALTAKCSNYSKFWYCPKHIDNKIFWVDYRYAIPPLYNCLFEMLETEYDPILQKVASKPGMTVGVPDFGGVDGISYLDSTPHSWHIIGSFAKMVEFFKSNGYTIKKDLFGAPYDWRIAMAGLDSEFFLKLRNLVETAFYANNKRKVALVGFSLGCFIIQTLLLDWADQQWKNTFLSKVIYLCPAFAGSSTSIDVAYRHYFPILSYANTPESQALAEHFSALYALLPNHVVFGDRILIHGQHGEQVNASMIPKYLLDNGKIPTKCQDIMMKNVEFSRNAPAYPGVPVSILYNSGIQTPFNMSFENNKPIFGKVEGDGTVPAIAPRWVCNEWASDGKTVVCNDLSTSDLSYDHSNIGCNVHVHKLIYDAVVSDDWMKSTTDTRVVK